MKSRVDVLSAAPGVGINYRRLRIVAGLASAVVPFAVAVHLIAEAAAVGPDGLGFDFVARHLYFVALLSAAAWWFGAIVGVGQPAAERRRRNAILRADLSGKHGLGRLAVLTGSQLAFFALTQAVEGVPIVSGAVALGLGVVLAGSLLCAALVFFFGRSIIVAGLDSVIGTAPRPASTALACRRRAVPAPRHAASAFTLFVPNRPPPIVSPT